LFLWKIGSGTLPIEFEDKGSHLHRTSPQRALRIHVERIRREVGIARLSLDRRASEPANANGGI